MNKHGLSILLLLILISWLFVGCAQRTSETSTSDMSSEEIQTAAAQTMAALPEGQETTPQPKHLLYLPMVSGNKSSVSEGSGSPEEATPTPSATFTRTPTSTPVPDTLTPTTPPCYAAEFVEHINVPPGTKFTGGSKFTKIWRVKNTGSCAWYGTYTLVLVSGDGMGGGSDTPINAAVAPSQTVDLMIDLTAPKNNGRYKSGWMIYNLAGQVFGVGNDSTGYLWADIKVVNEATATSKTSSKATATTKPSSTTAPSSTPVPPSATSAPTSTSTPTPTPTETPTPTLTPTV
ncbi:MAG: hypothetical protein JW908_00980 [Anaerolineales bacterium]|nr:hypothetical protein [Anaerolineales bacterium]